ncbi:MAG: nucleotidyltransferase family protein [Chloroflexi bacterium]|nr:nucleotidyltransferase family protein [Chloroflexota bacterium]
MKTPADGQLQMPDDKGQARPSGSDFQGAVSFLHALVTPEADALAGWMSAHQLDNAAVEWLRVRGLAPYTFYRLSAASLIAQAAEEPQAVLRLAYYIARDKAEQRTRELGQVLAALAAAGITPVLFKGAALAYTAYPDPACRMMGDLDLWLTAEEMPAARTVLEGLGYGRCVKEARPPAFQERYLGEVPMWREHPRAILVELHWSAFPGVWLARTAAVDHALMRERAAPVMIAGQPALALAPEDAVIQVAVHLAINHSMAKPWLRGLMDIALLARTQAVDWRLVAERARAWRVSTTVWLVLQLAAELVGLTEAASALGRLAPSPLRRRLLAGLVNAGSMLAMRDLSRGPWRFALLLLLVDRPSDAAHVIGRALWPEDDWLVARYGRTGVGVRIAHLTGAIRGRF